MMTLILQTSLPEEMQVAKTLPGVAPCDPSDWLRVDDAYSAQMAYRAQLLRDKAADVLWLDPAAFEAAQEVLDEIIALLPDLGFKVLGDHVLCPDGREVTIDRDAPLHTLGHLVQEDICILQKRGAEHVLSGAVVCFPANWRLAEKAARPLSAIHAPVEEYDTALTTRVQRMFNAVRVGHPLWRLNRLFYEDADLHQPSGKVEGDENGFIRSERQCILRLPKTQAVVFTIHTYVVCASDGGPQG